MTKWDKASGKFNSDVDFAAHYLERGIESDNS